MKILPPLKKIDDINFQQIINSHNPPRKSKYILPRIAFIGYFQYLSMTCQRDICKYLGFEYFEEIPLAVHEPNLLQIISTKWTRITKTHTKLIVLGNAFDETPFIDFEYHLYKKYKSDMKPAIYEYNIPIIKEKEILKLHIDYPKISNTTRWESEYLRC
jgi:hypothetical protein